MILNHLMSVSSQGKIEVVQFSKNVAEHFCVMFLRCLSELSDLCWYMLHSMSDWCWYATDSKLTS